MENMREVEKKRYKKAAAPKSNKASYHRTAKER
jgi:hypothetical protein